MITICFTYFKSLTLANFAAALYSVRCQDLTNVEEVVVVDNDTLDAERDVQSLIDCMSFPIPVPLLSFSHGDKDKTHSWSTNAAVKEVETPWMLICRADYLLSFNALRRMLNVVEAHPSDWDGFVTSNGCHLAIEVEDCERTNWRHVGPGIFGGTTFDHTLIDAGVFMMRKGTFDSVGGLDERLSAWGHAQTEFQHRLFKAGVEFVKVPETLFYHPRHNAPRDLDLGHRQLAANGIDLKELWKRYDGLQPYGGPS